MSIMKNSFIPALAFLLISMAESRAGEWPDHYSVLESYSGPAQFGPSDRQYDRRLSLAFHALHPEETYGWNVPLQAKTIFDKAPPSPARSVGKSSSGGSRPAIT